MCGNRCRFEGRHEDETPLLRAAFNCSSVDDSRDIERFDNCFDRWTAVDEIGELG